MESRHIKAVLGSSGRQATRCRRSKASALTEGRWPNQAHQVLGLPYVEFPVTPGDAAGVARFYETLMGAPATVSDDGAGVAARVRVGGVQALVFRETTQPLPAYDGHHIAM